MSGRACEEREARCVRSESGETREGNGVQAHEGVDEADAHEVFARRHALEAQRERLLGPVPQSVVGRCDEPAAVVESHVGPSAGPTMPRWPVQATLFRRPPNVKSISLM